jgi:hypothetical protein
MFGAPAEIVMADSTVRSRHVQRRLNTTCTKSRVPHRTLICCYCGYFGLDKQRGLALGKDFGWHLARIPLRLLIL